MLFLINQLRHEFCLHVQEIQLVKANFGWETYFSEVFFDAKTQLNPLLSQRGCKPSEQLVNNITCLNKTLFEAISMKLRGLFLN